MATTLNTGLAFDAVIFDVGNVLIDYDPHYLYDKLIANPEDRNRFLAEVCTPNWNEKQDLGRSFAQGIGERLALFPQHEKLIRAYDERWQEMVRGPIEGSVALLEELAAAGMPLFALTNYSREKFAETLERFPFFSHFRDIVVSAHEGVVKPDPYIFDIAIKRFGVDPARTLFIDDRFANVEAARVAGLEALHFSSPEKLRADLSALGIMARAA
ncbi:MAG: 2-haloalkanoic acid dehalogenase [Hyphomicrobiales bacterium]|nr:MAG: 2-haloalkanoic acid dehalogenase [Hyphomicrobiales bacterium]